MQPADSSLSGVTSALPSEAEEQTGLGAGLDFTDPNSPLAPYYLRLSEVWAVVLLALLFIVLSLAPLWHTDVWGHLKFGQKLVAEGRWPAGVSLCSHEDAQSPFRTTYWLAQAGMYFVYHAGEMLAGTDATARLEGGVEFLRSLHAVVCMLRFLVLWLAFRRLGASPLLALGGLVLLLVLSLGNMAVQRPQVVGELFFACLLLALSRPVLSRRALWVVPAVLVVWANCHGSYAVGLCLPALCLLGRAVEVAGWRRPWALARLRTDPQVRRLFMVLVASVGLVALLNPSGPWLFWNTVRMGRQSNVLTMDEWQPLPLRLGAGPHWTYYLLLAGLVTTSLLCRRWPSPTVLLLGVFFGLQPLLHKRALVWSLLLVPWLLMPSWRELASRWRVWPEGWRSVPSFRKTLLAAAVILIAALWLAPVNFLTGGKPAPLALGLSAATPSKLPAVLESPTTPEARALFHNYPQGRYAGRIFASETLGDYLLWALPTEDPVVIYTHVHLFPPEHWKDCQVVKCGAVGWEAVLARGGVNLVLVEAEMHPHLRAALLKSPDWTVALDETGLAAKHDYRCRLFLAVRKVPLGMPRAGKPGETGKQARD